MINNLLNPYKDDEILLKSKDLSMDILENIIKKEFLKKNFKFIKIFINSKNYNIFNIVNFENIFLEKISTLKSNSFDNTFDKDYIYFFKEIEYTLSDRFFLKICCNYFFSTKTKKLIKLLIKEFNYDINMNNGVILDSQVFAIFPDIDNVKFLVEELNASIKYINLNNLKDINYGKDSELIKNYIQNKLTNENNY